MAVFRPFKGVRPVPAHAADVAALPYDVMNSEEARAMAAGKPISFLHVDKAEIDLPPGTGLYTREVYLKAKSNLEKLVQDGICVQDTQPHIYIYRQVMNGRSQTGLVGCAGVDDYLNNTIKKHELTRADKEADRTNHVDTLDANTGPIFLIYRENRQLAALIDAYKAGNKPVYDFVTEDGIANTVWVIDDAALTSRITAEFANTQYLYIADGHHRAASAVSVAKKRRAANPGYTGEEEFNFFLAVAFPQNELEIMDYNRLIKDLNGLDFNAFAVKVKEKFDMEDTGAAVPYKPAQKHTFGMYYAGRWYKLTAKTGTYDDTDPVGRLDVSILQDNLIAPVLGINDPRTDKRIDFVGGIRGLGELERRAGEDMVLAFSMCPTTIDELMAIADADKIMPPKSTWFEPKLLSGLFIHRLA